ncbi:MAG TPA: gas vesicle protein GvpD [Methanomassiliicoccales archaeon]|nr:gas vesicle protein GvpD [Methanomassiliicoccales archaeon]HPR97831.1 gas vesicle protein GvpD [Methanomassiliicoccales archaeon]
MPDPSNSALPNEITRFLENPGGHSLIVRGNAGTGKTTFVLQVAEEFKDRQRAHYLSTRVSDSSLLRQFPWLADRLITREETSTRRRSGFGRLKGVGSGDLLVSRKEMTVSIGRTMPDLENLYDLVEKAGERVLVIIDSIDALADRYELQCRELMIALQRDLVEGQGANLLFVLENNDHMLDYLGDGVVECTRMEHERRLVREMDLMKLRGVEVQQPLYLFSLKGGKFRCFGAKWDRGSGMSNEFARPEDPAGHLSFGITDLDEMTGGLFPGAVTLIELGGGLPPLVSGILERSLVSSFAKAGRGVLWVPLRKESGAGARGMLQNVLTDGEMEKTVRVVEPASQMDQGSGRYVMAVEGTRVSDDLKWKNIVYALNGSSQPFLSLMGFDSLESIYGGEVMEGLIDHLAAVKRNGGSFVGLTSPTSRSTARLADLATVHLKVERIGGTVVLYGSKPFTECFALTVEERPQGGCVSLTPLV